MKKLNINITNALHRFGYLRKRQATASTHLSFVISLSRLKWLAYHALTRLDEMTKDKNINLYSKKGNVAIYW